jgi:hypothetical protein
VIDGTFPLSMAGTLLPILSELRIPLIEAIELREYACREKAPELVIMRLSSAAK